MLVIWVRPYCKVKAVIAGYAGRCQDVDLDVFIGIS
jgi:hypothetical protein